MKLTNRLFYLTGQVAILGLIGVFFLSFYWQTYPYHIEDTTLPLPILNAHHQIKPGETIRWEANIKTYMSVPVDYLVTLVAKDGQTGCDYKVLGQGSTFSTIGQLNFNNATYIVPLDFPHCIYHVLIKDTYHPNPSTRTVLITKVSEDFYVI